MSVLDFPHTDEHFIKRRFYSRNDIPGGGDVPRAPPGQSVLRTYQGVSVGLGAMVIPRKEETC